MWLYLKGIYKTILQSSHVTDTPQGLYNEAQFDIRLCCYIRGNENMGTMSTGNFRVRTYENSLKNMLRKAVDELTTT